MKRTALTITLLIFSVLTCWAIDRALLIGIGHYAPNTGWKAIHGDADIALLKPRLEIHGFKVNTLINEEATKNAIKDAFYGLLNECEPGDRVYIHFSGHGQHIQDINGDENDRWDETMVPFDAGKYYEKGIYEGDRHFIDDEYNHILAEIKDQIGKTGEIFVAVDACYSQNIDRNEGGDSSIRGTADEFTFDDNVPGSIIDIQMPKPFSAGAGMTIVTACREDERNYEYKTASGKMYGSLSYCIAELLKENADFNKWKIFFQQEEYRNFKIFLASQHPTITTYN